MELAIDGPQVGLAGAGLSGRGQNKTCLNLPRLRMSLEAPGACSRPKLSTAAQTSWGLPANGVQVIRVT